MSNSGEQSLGFILEQGLEYIDLGVILILLPLVSKNFRNKVCIFLESIDVFPATPEWQRLNVDWVLQHFPGLRSIVLVGKTIETKHLYLLSNITRLERVELHECSFLTYGIHLLSRLPSLNFLDISSPEITSVDLSGLIGIRTLETLICSGRNIVFHDLQYLTGLRCLNISSATSRFEQYSHLITHLTGLTNLNISYCKAFHASHISDLTNLVTLNARSCNFGDISPLSALINLESLDVGSNHLINATFSEMTRLTFLYANGCRLEGHLFLPPSLRMLNMGNNKIRALSPLPNLTRLLLVHNRLEDANFLWPMTSLEYLNLFDNEDLQATESLSVLTRMHHLDVGLCSIHNLGFVHSLPMLRHFAADCTSLSEFVLSDINILPSLTSLTFLSFNNVKFADDVVQQFSLLTNLQSLSLFNSNIKTVTMLSNLTRLRKLNISACPIADFSPLSHLNYFQLFSV